MDDGTVAEDSRDWQVRFRVWMPSVPQLIVTPAGATHVLQSVARQVTDADGQRKLLHCRCVLGVGRPAAMHSLSVVRV